MPIFNLVCTKCSKKTPKLLPKRPDAFANCECGGEVVSENNISAMIFDTFDNGLMTKKVHRLTNIEELMKERQRNFLTKTRDSDDGLID
jgi:hypothetical protein